MMIFDKTRSPKLALEKPEQALDSNKPEQALDSRIQES
jgi:hypothetical protein